MPDREEVPEEAVAAAKEAIDSLGGDAVLAAAAIEAATDTSKEEQG